MAEKIHIVCLDAPSPPDYGGAIDMYYKVQALGEAGYQVILHYFTYNNRTSEGLSSYCSEIHAYKRSGPIKSLFGKQPYIVSSRVSQDLLSRLNADHYPIILEGIHCTGIIPYLNSNRKILVRVHNQEFVYYQRLALTERNPLKRLYFWWESKRLLRYEKSLPSGVSYACLSEMDLQFFQDRYSNSKSVFIPAFIPWTFQSKLGKGSYCLYHGNLTVAENEEAALWLIRHVFSNSTVPLIIAGKGASKNLIRTAAKHSLVKVFSDPAFEELEELIQNAHINLIHSLNETGVKLKLIHALLKGRFCIANPEAVQGSNVESGVIIANSSQVYLEHINNLMHIPFTDKDQSQRWEVATVYDNRKNAEKLSAFL